MQTAQKQPASQSDPESDDLRREIGVLGTMLGDTIRQFAGEEALATVEKLRRAAWDRREGREGSDAGIKQLIAGLDDQQMRVVIRAFSIFLDLLNVVEDRRRVQVLNERARDAYPGPRVESIRAAIAKLKEAGKSGDQIRDLIERLHVDLVFTAHPTDAKRRSVRSKLTAIREWMKQVDNDPLPEVRDRIETKIRAEIVKLWQTDFIRPWRPSVMQEVARGLSIKPVLWREVPRIAEELAAAVREHYGKNLATKRSCLTFGSWIGGDRDGHPGVTADVTSETFDWLRREAIAFHLQSCDALFDSLSISNRQVPVATSLEDALQAAIARWPELETRLVPLPPGETFRRWLSIIRWKLEGSRQQLDKTRQNAGTPSGQHAYQSACELSADVSTLAGAVAELPAAELLADDVSAWQTQIESFGLHLARLDVRQNANVYFDVINEMLRLAGIHEAAETLDEHSRCQLLADSLDQRCSIDIDQLSPMGKETVSLFRVLHRVANQYSMAAIGAHVISMTSAASDVVSVLWLWQQSRDHDSTELASDAEQRSGTLPIVPLLETIDDLANGPAILTEMLSTPAYREHVRRLGDHQMIMLGYSDSTKDGGYLSACWSLYQAQQTLVGIAEQHGVKLTFFHGRGGSLGRGGGPAARSILSLPEGTFDGRLRLTEQGEVLADRYDDPAIAHRHLEQVVWSSLLAAENRSESDSQQWHPRMQQYAEASFAHYRKLLEQPEFVEFFRCVTPISEIEQLPIGSRPSRRKPDGGLSDLRAIPWVFSWTQSRCLIPAWYGIGSALGSHVDENSSLDDLKRMYQHWPFFRALVDNAELALAKSDLPIAAEYASLAGDRPSLKKIGNLIEQEYRESCRVVLALTGRSDLLDGTRWLKESIRVRNRFIDPLNLIQIELLRRGKSMEESEDRDEWRHLTRLSINGIAAGMRTSG